MTLFTREERARFERAGRTAQMLARSLERKTPTELVQDVDTPYLQKMMLRMSGATLGRQLGTGTLQAPEMFATLFENLGRGGVMNAEMKLIERAMFDDDLFKALIETPQNGQLSEKSNRALRAWAAQTLATYGNERQEMEESNTQ